MNTAELDTLPRGQRLPALLQSGVWLVFLASPVIAMFQFEKPSWAVVVGLTGTVAFSTMYLVSFVHTRPLTAYPRWVSTVAYTCVLLVLAALIWVGASYTAIAVAPYIAATWLFKHRMPTGIVAAGLILAVLAVLTLTTVPAPARGPLAGSVSIAVLMITGVRFAVEKEDQSRALHEQLALAQQRESWARDVHDILGHSLTVVAVKTELARKLLDRDPERARVELDEVLALTREALGEVRSTVTSLRTPDLGTQLLAARSACEAAGLAFSAPSSDAADAVPEPQRELFAWCLREAITNVVRHAQARSCTVTLTSSMLEVTDDGVGFTGPEGNGIRGVRERCESLGATLTLIPGARGSVGTKVVVRV